MKELEWKLKHDTKDVIEACAEVLQRDMGFNPKQIKRYFSVFPMSDIDPLFKSLEDPSANPENWYHLKETQTHIGLLFNYETKEYVLLSPEHDWKRPRIADLKKTEEELEHDEELYSKKMEEFINTKIYKDLKPLIDWYYSCPIPSARRAFLPSPNDFILKVLEKFSKKYDIENKNLNEIRDSLFWAYHYEERKNEK